MVLDPPLQDHVEPGQNYQISELSGQLFLVSQGFFRVVILGKSQFDLELKLIAFENRVDIRSLVWREKRYQSDIH